ncbi:MAG: hypothetical protein ABIX01_11895 [Chitinophagaceae bacterium]
MILLPRIIKTTDYTLLLIRRNMNYGVYQKSYPADQPSTFELAKIEVKDGVEQFPVRTISFSTLQECHGKLLTLTDGMACHSS